MAATRKSNEPAPRRRPPATTLQGRENQLIAMAYDEAERQILEGRATSQLLTHFLKLGTTREQLEQKKIANETRLTDAKIESLESQKNVEKLYADALKAMKSYDGTGSDDDYEE